MDHHPWCEIAPRNCGAADVADCVAADFDVSYPLDRHGAVLPAEDCGYRTITRVAWLDTANRHGLPQSLLAGYV
ncbi:hypothetical protein ABW05_30905 [Mycolicibacterium senegalense]|uniref:Uncharacterized protein n=1 Tax=Mycolicibacterium senegalense TaxID=1796 RepID=A0ABR5FMB4_9MYCO|nr:hypothetical protein ABW05_30905 [Mycolicibacterium senegalense]